MAQMIQQSYKQAGDICARSIVFIFVAEEKKYLVPLFEELTYTKFTEIVSEQIRKFSGSLKAFVKVFREGQPMPKYIKIQKEREVMEEIKKSTEGITVELFYQRREDGIKVMVDRIGATLTEQENNLQKINNQLKDEMNRFYALDLFRRNTSTSIEQQLVKVFLVVCDPLVEKEKEEGKQVFYPLYHDEVDIPSHLQRLRKASLSSSNLSIKVERIWGTEKQLRKTLKTCSSDIKGSCFSVVQIFTRVQKINNVLMMSMESDQEGELGLRVWVQASELFKQEINANIMIIVGVGVYQLKRVAEEANFTSPLILVTSISLQNMHIISTTHDRSFLDVENIFHDRYCQTYLEYFYSELFSRREVGRCHQKANAEASQTLISKKTSWCCCLHPHSSECEWPKIVRRLGQTEAHRLFKHDEFPIRSKEYLFRQNLQELLLNKRQNICNQQDSGCCYKLMGRTETVKVFHQFLRDMIVWNGCESNQIFRVLCTEQRPNKFDCKMPEKPTGRRCPLTISRVIGHVLQNTVSIIRAPMISQAKRFYTYAKEYIQLRRTGVAFYEHQVSSLQNGKTHKSMHESKHKSVYDTKLGKSVYEAKLGKTQTQISVNLTLREKISEQLKKNGDEPLLVNLHYSQQKSQQYYQELFRQICPLLFQEENTERLKLVLMTEDEQFTNQKVKSMIKKSIPSKSHYYLEYNPIETIHIEDVDPNQRYHYYLSQYSYDSVKKNFEEIRGKIKDGERKNEEGQREIMESMESMKREDEDLYMFLGFLSQFNEDGFYLSKVSSIILAKMFRQQILDKTLSNDLPVEVINMGEHLCLQLHRYVYNYFSNPSNGDKIQFQQRKMQFYYLRMRLYFQYWPLVNVVNYPGVIRNFINKQGIFSIDIQRQNIRYDSVVLQCKKELGDDEQTIRNAMHDIKNTLHAYHLTQVQKILQEFLKKKRSKQSAFGKESRIYMSGLYIDERRYKRFQYLLWNIVLKSWLMSRVISSAYSQTVRKFQAVLLVFFIQAQISIPIAEIAKTQLYVLMNKSPPKIEDRDFGKLTSFIKFYRHYAFKDMALANAQPEWGSHRKCKELFGSCFQFACLISGMIDGDSPIAGSNSEKKANKEFREYIQTNHKMFSSSNSTKWMKECLKLIERKVLYYFKVTSELKRFQGYQEFQDNVKAFQTYFKFSQLEYQFNKYKGLRRLEESSSVLGAIKLKNTQLIEYYIEAQKVGVEVEKESLDEFKGKISPEYMPIFNYLCQKIEQKALFNQKGLVIFARARTIVCDQQPYIFSRRRTLLPSYMSKLFQGKDLKVSYHPLTDKTLKLFGINKNNYKCEVFSMVLTIDAASEDELLFGAENGVDAVKMSTYQFAQMISRCRIKLLIINGKNSTKVCQKLRELSVSQKCRVSLGESTMTHSLSNSFNNKFSSSNIRPADRINKMLTTSTIGARPNSQIKSSNKSSSTSRSKASGSNIKNPKRQPIYFDGFPTIIAIQSSRYSLGDVRPHLYPKNISEEEQSKRSISSVGSRVLQSSSSRPSLYQRQGMMQVEERQIQEEQENEQLEDIDHMLETEVRKDILNEVYVDNSKRIKFPTIFDKAQSQSDHSQELELASVQNYLGNQVHGIAMDLIIIAFLKYVTKELSSKNIKIDQKWLRSIIQKSKNVTTKILSKQFECTETVMNFIHQKIWVNDKNILQKIETKEGEVNDLTKMFYCAQNNLHDQHYYENIGNCMELHMAFKYLQQKINCIEIVGGSARQRSSLLQEICWMAQSKSLFKFGITKVDFKSGNFNAVKDRTFKKRENDLNCQTGVLVAIDNIEAKFSRLKKDFQKLCDKSFTIIYASADRDCCDQIRKTINIDDFRRIDLDQRSQQEFKNVVYATMLAHLKQKSDWQYTSQVLGSYQTKIDQIMDQLFLKKDLNALGTHSKRNELEKAMEMLRGPKPKSEDERAKHMLYFYQQHYDELFYSLKELKEISVRIV